MTKQEIFAIEDNNTDKIYLFLEGTFWKAYEKSAFSFVKFVKPYKANKKDIKYLNREMVSIGFPESSIAEIRSTLDPIEQCEDKIVFSSPEAVETEKFDKWKSMIQTTVTDKKANPINDNAYEQSEKESTANYCLTEKIRNFDIATRTPMECMFFLSELKQHISK